MGTSLPRRGSRGRLPGRRRRLAGPAGLLAVAAAALAFQTSRPDPAARGPSGDEQAAGGYGSPVLLGSLDETAVTESSGLAASRRNPGLLWTHNDSGDGPFLYCLDLGARRCGVWRVTGAQALDWEDIAAGPGPRPGEPYLYVGDIGDNRRDRGEVAIYRVAEPAAAPEDAATTPELPVSTAPVEAIRLSYPDGPHDAEALLVHPQSGDLFLVTKEPSGEALVYRAAAPLGGGDRQTLALAGSIRIPGEPGSGVVLVTAGDIAPDGRRLALATYARAYELVLPRRPRRPFEAIWEQPLTPVELGLRVQGEALAYRLDGLALLATSERLPAPLYQVERSVPPVPDVPAGRATGRGPPRAAAVSSPPPARAARPPCGGSAPSASRA